MNSVRFDFFLCTILKAAKTAVGAILLLVFALLYPGKEARAEWIRMEPTGDIWYNYGFGNGRGVFSLPEGHHPPHQPDTGTFVVKYNLHTGQREWVRRFGNPYATHNYSYVNNQNRIIALCLADSIYSFCFDTNGTPYRNRIGYSPMTGEPQDHKRDDFGRFFYIDGSRKYLRFSPTGNLEQTVQLPRFNYSYMAKLAPDWQGGSYVWIGDIVNDSIRHYMFHIDSSGTIQGPTYVRTYHDTTGTHDFLELTYSPNSRKLIQFEYTGVNCIASTLDLQTFQVMRHDTVYRSLGYGFPAFASTRDTTWMFSLVCGYDSISHQYRVFNYSLQALTTDTIWRQVATFPDSAFGPTQGAVDLSTRICVMGQDIVVFCGNCGFTRIPDVSVSTRFLIVENPNLKVYPNPTNGSIVVNLLLSRSGRLRMTNLLGQTVATYSLPVYQNSYPIRLPSTLTSGEYFLEVSEPGNGTRVSKINFIK